MHKNSEVTCFWEAHNEALFDQKKIALVVGLSEKWLERMRWAGGGIPYKKIGRRVFYRKCDVVAWLSARPVISSTSVQSLQEAS